MNFSVIWPQRVQRLWLQVRQLARRWQTMNALLQIAGADAHGVGQFHQWFGHDVPVEGMLSWIEHRIITAPRPDDMAFDQFVVHLIPTSTDNTPFGKLLHPDTLPTQQVLLRWDGERADWVRSGRARCAAAIGPEHEGMLVVVWSMSAAACGTFASPPRAG